MRPIDTSQLRTALDTAANVAQGQPGHNENNDVRLNDLNVRNIYLGKNGDIHVSKSSFSRLVAQLLNRKTGLDALKQGMLDRGLTESVADKALAKIRYTNEGGGAFLLNMRVDTLGEAITMARTDTNEGKPSKEYELGIEKNKLENELREIREERALRGKEMNSLEGMIRSMEAFPQFYGSEEKKKELATLDEKKELLSNLKDLSFEAATREIDVEKKLTDIKRDLAGLK